MENKTSKVRQRGFSAPSKSTSVLAQKDSNRSDNGVKIKPVSNCVSVQDQGSKITTKISKQCVLDTKSFKKCKLNKKGSNSSIFLTDEEYETIFNDVFKAPDPKENVADSKHKGPLPMTDGAYEEIFKSVLEMPEMKENVADSKHKGPLPMTDGAYEGIFKSVLEMPEMKGDLHQSLSKPKKGKTSKMGDLHQSLPKPKKEKTSNMAHRTQKTGRCEKSMSKHIENENTSVFDGYDNEEGGTWIQCTNQGCSKWRYVPDIQDPGSVPEMWECCMNSDELHQSCSDPEDEYDEEEHILTKYTLGSIVWVKMDGFPWWPAMVECDPDYEIYFELPNEQSMNPISYHVTFFGGRVSRAWIKPSQILPHQKKTYEKYELSKRYHSCKGEMVGAVKDAEKAFSMSLKNRLLEFGFSTRYSAKSNILKRGTLTSDEEEKESTDGNDSSLKSKKKVKMSKKSCKLPGKFKLKQKITSGATNLDELDQQVPDMDQPLVDEKTCMSVGSDSCYHIDSQADLKSGKTSDTLMKTNDKDLVNVDPYICRDKESDFSSVPDINDTDAHHDDAIEDKDEKELDLDMKDDIPKAVNKGHCGQSIDFSDHEFDSDPLDLIED